MILPLFFAAHVVVVALLIPALRVQDPLYHTFPWIFGGAFLLTLVPALRRRLDAGAPVYRALPVLLYATVITLASSVNPRATTGVPGNVFHPVEYAGLAFLGLYAWHAGFSRAPTRRGVLLVLIACVAFGALDEVHQSFVPHRDPDLFDVGRDALGALAGAALYLGWGGVRSWWRARASCS